MAARYWVGGAGNWSSTTKWSTSSGGASGASVPISTDDVIFDANSGGKFTATVDTAQTVNSITITPSTGAGVLQIALSAALTTGALTTTGTAGNNRIWFRSSTYGIAFNFVINSTVSISDCDFCDIYVIGTSKPISGTRIGNLGGCSGITFDVAKTVYWNQAAGGNWSGTNWAATSGGAVADSNFPLAQDTAVIGNTGLNTSATVTVDTAITNLSGIDMSGRTNAMTLANGTVAPIIFGDWKNGSGTTLSGTGALTFGGRNTQTITSAGVTFTQSITIDSYGGTVQLADALNIGTGNLTFTNGTFDTKNYNVTANSLTSNNSNVRAIILGSSTVTLGAGGAIVSASTITNLTFNAGTSTIVGTSSGAISTGGINFYNVNLTLTTANIEITISGANTYNNLTITAPTSGLRTITFFANQTVNGTLTASGASAVQRIFLRSYTLGTTRTLTVNSLSANDCDFRDITIAGTAAGTAPTRAGDCGGNTGITFPAPKTVYWNLAGNQSWSATGWATSSGGTPALANFPLAQDTAVFDNTGSVTGTIAINGSWNIGTFDASARTSAMTLTTGTTTPFIYGDWKFGTGVTSSSTTGTITFSKRGTQTITSNGVTFGCPVTIDSATGTGQLADALTLGSARALTLTSGTFDAVSYNVTTGSFSVTSSATTLKMGSGTWTLSGTLTLWNFSSNPVFYKGTANIVLSDTSTSGRTFRGGSLSYNKLTIGGTTGISTLTIEGTNQFTELASTKTVAHTIALGTANQTLGKWSVTGTAGNVVTVTGTATLTIAGAAVSGVDYLALGTTVLSTTSPGEFFAGANSTGGTNFTLTAAPTPRTLYWVGGTGNWSSTTKWSTASGGASGAAIPTSLDNVVFDSASNATAYTATIDPTQARCAALTVAGPASGNLTLAGTGGLACHGSVTLPATGLTLSYTGAITLSSSSTGLTFTTNGQVISSSSFVINGINSSWSLGSAFSDAGGTTISVNNGSFNTANYNLSCGLISSSNSNSRTLSFGSSTVTVSSGNSGTNAGIYFANNINLTLNTGTSTIVFSQTGSPEINGGNSSPSGSVFYNVSFTSAPASAISINGANTFNNLSFTGRATAGLKTVSLSANQTINGTLTISAGTDATMRTFIQSNTLGTTRTLTCAAFSGTDVDFRDITIAGAAAPVSGTRLGDCKGNSGITFPAGISKYWNLAAGGNWSATGWATTGGGTPAVNNFPLAQDTAVFQSTGLTSGSTVTINANYNIGTIDMSARTSNTMTLANPNTPAIYGNWINGTGTTLSMLGTLTFAGRGSQTITSAGITFTNQFTINTPNGSVTLQDALISSNGNGNALRIDAGTLDANNYNLTMSASSVGVNSSATTTAKTLAIGSGTWTIAGTNGWNANTSTTITGTGTISLTSASAKTFAGGGISYVNITINQGGAGALTISGNNTFKNITNSYSATGAANINIGTTTQTVSQFTATGSAGKVLTIQGTSASSPGTLVLTGGTVSVDYLAITGVRAYNLNTTWYAGNNSTNNGSLGWLFSTGGTIYSVSLTEAGSAADALSAVLNFIASITEAATAVDSYDAAGSAYSTQVQETATATDVETATLSFTSALTETVTATDAETSAVSTNNTLTETVTATDVESASQALTTTLTETVTATDVESASQALATALTETVTATDVEAATLALTNTLTETVTATDVEAATQVLATTLIETVTATDIYTAAGSIYNTQVQETLTAQDVVSSILTITALLTETATASSDQTVTVTLLASIAEAATAADSQSALLTLVAQLAEIVTAADDYSAAGSVYNVRQSENGLATDSYNAAGSIYNVALLEALLATDTVAGRLLWELIDDLQSANWGDISTAQSPNWGAVDDTQTANWSAVSTVQSPTWTTVTNTQDPNWVDINIFGS